LGFGLNGGEIGSREVGTHQWGILASIMVHFKTRR
jgi:hypothetical protein